MGIVLIGPPNVGKSVLFNRLTGLDVGIANYPGTTVDFKKGKGSIDGYKLELIDLPGTYSLDAENPAEKIAVDMLSDETTGVICVLDAVNLESSIYLLIQVLSKELPTVAVINRTDLINGSIDIEYLSSELGIPIVTTIATKGIGIDQLKNYIKQLLKKEIQPSSKKLDATWNNAERIKKKTQVNKLDEDEKDDILIKPFPGIPLALLITGIMFLFVIGLGLGLRQYVLLPFFNNFVFPPITSLVESVVAPGILRNILIGEYGFLIKSIEWPLGLVLPYVLSFYTALSVLEDSGYMPRLAALIDGVFKKIGLSGSHLIPFLLGYGCTIPSILATRAVGNRKQRILISSMVCLSVPCVAQSGAFIVLLAEYSLLLVIAMFFFSIIAAFVSGMFLSKLFKIKRAPLILEIPELLIPDFKMLGKKILIRVKHFLLSGAIPMIIIIGVASVLYETGVLMQIGEWMEPFITGWLGLPKDASTPLILGIFRRELAVLPLLDMNLSTLQLFVASIIALFYIPCIAVLGVLAKEFSFKISAFVLFLTLGVSFFIGGVIAQLGMLFF